MIEMMSATAVMSRRLGLGTDNGYALLAPLRLLRTALALVDAAVVVLVELDPDPCVFVFSHGDTLPHPRPASQGSIGSSYMAQHHRNGTSDIDAGSRARASLS